MRKLFISVALAMSCQMLARAQFQFLDFDPSIDVPPEATHDQFFDASLVVPDTVVALKDVGTLAAWMKPHPRSKPGRHASEVARAADRQKPDLSLWSQKLKAPAESK
jgi:hypothetical protein